MESALVETFGTWPVAYRYDERDRQAHRPRDDADRGIRRRGDRQADDARARRLDGLHRALADATRKAFAAGIHALVDESSAPTPRAQLPASCPARVPSHAVGLAFDRFVVGAFGSDHEDRSQLPPVALARAQALLGRALAGDRLVIIGDTPADVHCGRGVGARAIAVATGGYTVEELDAHAPAATFADLRDTARVLEAIRDA
jgi:beta-phosphoglucomutase-like phosphatase (HAD superfamily)